MNAMHNVSQLAWLAQLATTLPLVGLIWLVQVVAYPLFAHVGPAEFAVYHRAHSTLITLVVGPLMVVELGAAGIWALHPEAQVSRAEAFVGLALVLVAWAVTMFASVPQHNILARGFDALAHSTLVATNWLRTLAWTARGVILLSILWRRG